MVVHATLCKLVSGNCTCVDSTCTYTTLCWTARLIFTCINWSEYCISGNFCGGKISSISRVSTARKILAWSGNDLNVWERDCTSKYKSTNTYMYTFVRVKSAQCSQLQLRGVRWSLTVIIGSYSHVVASHRLRVLSSSARHVCMPLTCIYVRVRTRAHTCKAWFAKIKPSRFFCRFVKVSPRKKFLLYGM